MSSVSGPESFNTFPQEIIPQLLCSFCLEEYRDPRDLDCGHSFCSECLQGYVESTWNKITGGDGVTAAKARRISGLIKCPECRERTLIPIKGVKNLKTNFALKHVLEKVAQQRQREKSIPVCLDHDEKQLFYCMTCSKTICCVCTLLDHPMPSHEWKKVVDVYTEQRESLGKIADETKDTSRRFLDFMRCSSNLLADVRQAAEKAERDICNHVEAINIDLQMRKDVLLREVHRIRDCRVHRLEEEQVGVTLAMTHINDELQVIKEAEDQGYLHDFVRRFESMKESLSAFCHATPPYIEECLAVLQFLPKKLQKLDVGYIATVRKTTLKFCGEFGMGLIWGLGGVGGIAATPDGGLAITETKSRRVSVWEIDRGQYNLKFYMAHLTPFLQNLFGLQLGSILRHQLSCPTDIAVTSDGEFAVLDGVNGMKLFSKSGALDKYNVLNYDVRHSASLRKRFDCVAADQHGKVYTCTSTLIEVYEKIPEKLRYKQMYLKTLAVQLRPRKLSTDGKLMLIMVEMEDLDLSDVRIRDIIATDNGRYVMLDHDLDASRDKANAKPKAVIVYDLDIWEVIVVFEVTSDTNNICYDKNTGSVFVTTDSGCVDQYCVGMGRFVGRLVTGLDHPRGLAVTADNVLAVGNNATVKLYHIK